MQAGENSHDAKSLGGRALAEVCEFCLLLNLAISGKPKKGEQLEVFQDRNDTCRSRAVIKHACLLKYVYNRYGIL